MPKTSLFKLALKLIGGPAAGAFGLWLATGFPEIWSAVCRGSL